MQDQTMRYRSRLLRPQRVWRTALRTCVLLVMGGVGGEACARADRADRASHDGTSAMVDTLAGLYARARSHPERYQFLNRERADAIESQLPSHGGSANVQGRLLLARERLLAGQSAEAIDAIEAILRDVGLQGKRITPETRQVYDLLAIAYLRMGEQKNCVENGAANACILPLHGAARHRDETGARGAIAQYEALLASDPSDLGSRWLLNIASMAVGDYPGRVPKGFLIPRLLPDKSRPFPEYPNIAGALGLAVNGLSGGIAVEDFNRDGLLDLFMTSWGMKDQARLFLADGRGGYVEKTEQAGLLGIVGGLNVTHADFDNDGYEDLFVMRGAWLGDVGTQPNSLLHNRGDGTFEDVTIKAGLLSFHPTPTAAWADFNGDGRLDLFVGNESGTALGQTAHRSELFLNNGNGTFTEVSAKVGIDVDAFVKGAAWGDVNNDGLPDLYVSVLNAPNRLYVNLGGQSTEQWRFEERAAAAGVQLPTASFATWFWDFDNDGWEDLAVLSYDIGNGQALHDAVAREYLGQKSQSASQPYGVESMRLYRNNRDGTFTDVTRAMGLADKVIFAMGANFGDLDNDGWLDFYVGTGNPDLRSVIPNRMFRNVQGERFEEVTLEGGFGHIQKGHGAAFADLDRDGDEDIYMVMGGAYQGDQFANVLFENPGWKNRAWVALELEGHTANRPAIGARVAVDVVDGSGRKRTLRRTVGTGGSFGAGSLQLHIGLGAATRIERLQITWPDRARTTTTYGALEVNAYYRIVQGQAPARLERPPVPFRKSAGVSMVKHPM